MTGDGAGWAQRAATAASALAAPVLRCPGCHSGETHGWRRGGERLAKVLVAYYSMTGNTLKVAQAVDEGARGAGAQTRLRKVKELLPQEALSGNPGWQAYASASAGIQEATLEDLDWADGYVFGTPTRFGAMSAQLKAFFDSSGPLWGQGKLANKPVAAFTGAMNPHGGQETTLQNIYGVMQHWGAVLVPPGYTDQSVYASGGNPYGVSFTATRDASPSAETLQVARYLGGRIARFAAVLSEAKERLTAQ